MHFPDGYPWLTLSAILSYEARTFLTVIPFGNIPRDRLAKLPLNYTTKALFCQVALNQLFSKVLAKVGESLEIHILNVYALYLPV